ncbi:MAG: TonB-dependent siderophore receptor [Geitlerinemataceae cyanobacterium]
MLQCASAASAQDAIELAEISEMLAPFTESTAETVAQATPVEITAIEFDTDGANLQVRVETAGGGLTAPVTSTSGNAFILEISGASLAGGEVLEFNPADDIVLVQASELDGGVVRISITGSNAAPEVTIGSDAAGLTLGITPGIARADGDDDAIQIGITGENENDYIVPNATTATRTDSPLSDVPQSIQVIPRQLIEDEQAIGIEDVLDNVSGVTYQGNDDGRGTQFSIRGFGTFGSPVLRNGFRVYNGGGNAVSPEVANLERIEVLKGPASVLYGQADPGGVINLVTEQPTFEPYYNIQLQAGSYELYSPSIDISGPLTEDASVRYRLNMLYRHEGTFRDFDDDFDRGFIAPTIAWDINDRTRLTFGAEYVREDNPSDFGLLAFGNRIIDIPLDRVYVSNPDDALEKDYLSLGYTFEHDLSEDWTIRNEFQYVSDNYIYDLVGVPLAFDESTGNLTRILASQENERDNYSLYTNIRGSFDTGSIEHNLLFGVDLSREEDLGGGRGAFDPRVGPQFFSTINVFDPDFSFTKPSLDDAPNRLINDERADRIGVYLQNQMYLTDDLIVLAGLRYDAVDAESTSTTRFTSDGSILDESESEQYDDAVTPRVGIVYQPTDTISLYGSYAQSFNPSSATDINGDFLESETGEGFEIGVKADIIPDRLAATLSYFDITRQNVATADPNDPLLQASIATGEQQSRGIEFDINGEILPGWNIIASYTYLDAEITEDNTFEEGNQIAGIPEHMASLWTTYRIQSGDLEGLGFGLGLNYVGERIGDPANTYKADSYLLTSAAAFYRRDNWNFQLNIDNLFDIDYIESAQGGRFRGIYPGDPFTVRGSFSVTF